MHNTEAFSSPRWFVRRDLDGFFGLALDNLIQILVIVSLTQGVLQFPAHLVYGRILPSIAVSLVSRQFLLRVASLPTGETGTAR